MNEDEKLKPCPWCGKEPLLSNQFQALSITCMTEDCPVNPEVWADEEEVEAACIARWNTRAAPRTGRDDMTSEGDYQEGLQDPPMPDQCDWLKTRTIPRPPLSPESAKLIDQLRDRCVGHGIELEAWHFSQQTPEDQRALAKSEGHVVAARAALEDHLRELERDRERLDWLERNAGDLRCGWIGPETPMWCVYINANGYDDLGLDPTPTIRAAIDAAAAPTERDG